MQLNPPELEVKAAIEQVKVPSIPKKELKLSRSKIKKIKLPIKQMEELEIGFNKIKKKKDIKAPKIDLLPNMEIELHPKKTKGNNPLKYMMNKVYDSRAALMKFDFNLAQTIYVELLQEYNKLKDHHKAKIYEHIKELYEERKSAEKLFKK